LYLSVPIGQPAVEFNAQRIFHPKYILAEAKLNGLELQDFAYVDDAGNLHSEAGPPSLERIDETAKLKFGCGLFIFSKN
jgi:hypothetical protein